MVSVRIASYDLRLLEMVGVWTGSQSGTPDILWDSELSQVMPFGLFVFIVECAAVLVQTSEGSPHSPPPAVIVVSDSPVYVRKSECCACNGHLSMLLCHYAGPSLPAPLFSTGGKPHLVSINSS